jgi:hypothetical protein
VSVFSYGPYFNPGYMHRQVLYPPFKLLFHSNIEILYREYVMVSMFGRCAAFASACLLSACAATVSQPAGQAQVQTAAPVKSLSLLITGDVKAESAADWQTFRAEWRSAFTAAAAARGVAANYLEAEPTTPPASGVLVKMKVNDYRYLTPGARFGFGIMTGNAYIDADAQYIEYPGAKPLATRKFSTSSSAWQGVFSAMTDKQVRAISDEVVAELVK